MPAEDMHMERRGTGEPTNPGIQMPSNGLAKTIAGGVLVFVLVSLLAGGVGTYVASAVTEARVQSLERNQGDHGNALKSLPKIEAILERVESSFKEYAKANDADHKELWRVKANKRRPR